MGAVPIIVIGLGFSVDQIQKGEDAVLRQYKIRHGGDPGIQYGDGNALPAIGCSFRRPGGISFFEKHGKHLPSLPKYVGNHFWESLRPSAGKLFLQTGFISRGIVSIYRVRFI